MQLKRTKPLPTLKQRIANREARIGILGLTPEGLTTAVRYSRAGFPVTCIDLRDVKVERVRRGMSFTDIATDMELLALVESGRIKATTNVRASREIDFLIVFQDTPDVDVNARGAEAAFEAVARWLKKGVVICLGDDVEPQPCYVNMRNIMDAFGYRYGEDYLLGTFAR